MRKSRLTKMAALGAVAALAACSDGGTGPEAVVMEDAIAFQRLLVADAQAPSARLLALRNDSTLRTYALSGPASIVYRTSSGRYGAIQQRTANLVQFIDGGVWVDGNEGHRHAPAVLSFALGDAVPSYESVNGNWISVFFDGSGLVRWMNESEMLAGNPRVAFQANTGGPHHGGAFTVVHGGTPHFVHSTPNPAGGSPNGVAVRNGQGQVISELSNCPSLHGNNSIATGGVFGCNDGLVLVRGGATGVTAEKVTPTGDMAGLALRNAWAAPGSNVILGQFAALPGQPAQRVLATINPATGAIDRMPALPAGVVDHWRAIEPARGQIVILGNNGSLYVYGSGNRQLQRTVANVVPALPASAPLAHQVAVVEDLAAVASPYTGEVVLVNLATGAVIRRIALGGAPSRLTIVGATRSGQYLSAD